MFGDLNFSDLFDHKHAFLKTKFKNVAFLQNPWEKKDIFMQKPDEVNSIVTLGKCFDINEMKKSHSNNISNFKNLKFLLEKA